MRHTICRNYTGMSHVLFRVCVNCEMYEEEKKISSPSASPDRDRSFRPMSVESHTLPACIRREPELECTE